MSVLDPVYPVVVKLTLYGDDSGSDILIKYVLLAVRTSPAAFDPVVVMVNELSPTSSVVPLITPVVALIEIPGVVRQLKKWVNPHQTQSG